MKCIKFEYMNHWLMLAITFVWPYIIRHSQQFDVTRFQSMLAIHSKFVVCACHPLNILGNSFNCSTVINTVKVAADIHYISVSLFSFSYQKCSCIFALSLSQPSSWTSLLLLTFFPLRQIIQINCFCFVDVLNSITCWMG